MGEKYIKMGKIIFFKFLFLEATNTINPRLSSIRTFPNQKPEVGDNGHIHVLYSIIYFGKFRDDAQISPLAHSFGGKHFFPFTLHIFVRKMPLSL